MPSALAALGLEVPPGLDGTSFVERASNPDRSDYHDAHLALGALRRPAWMPSPPWRESLAASHPLGRSRMRARVVMRGARGRDELGDARVADQAAADQARHVQASRQQDVITESEISSRASRRRRTRCRSFRSFGRRCCGAAGVVSPNDITGEASMPAGVRRRRLVRCLDDAGEHHREPDQGDPVHEARATRPRSGEPDTWAG